MAEGQSFTCLGGYGQPGCLVATRPLGFGAASGTVTGHSRDKAGATAKDLAGEDGTGRVRPGRIGTEQADGPVARVVAHPPHARFGDRTLAGLVGSVWFIFILSCRMRGTAAPLNGE